MKIEIIEIAGVEYVNHIPEDGFIFIRKSDSAEFSGIVLGNGESINDYEEIETNKFIENEIIKP